MMNEGEEEVVADWCDVQYDLLALIAEKMISFSPSDFIRLGAVCVAWRSFLVENYEEIKLPNHLPVLLIPWPQENHDQNQQMNITEGSSNNQNLQRNIGLDVEDEEEDNVEEVKEKVNSEDGDSEEEEGDGDEGKEDDEDGDEEDDEDSSEISIDNDEDEDEDEDEEVEEEIDHWVIPRYYDPKEIFQGQDSERHKPTRAFYSLSLRKVYKDSHLAVPYFKNCVGSYKGWLVMVEEDEKFTVQLFNPFRSVNNTIQLPPLTTLDLGDPDECVRDSYCMIKVVFSASPSSIANLSDLVVMGIYSQSKPAFCRPGDTSWTCFRDVGYQFNDAIYSKGQFYAVQRGDPAIVMAFDFNPSAHCPLQPKVTVIAEPPAEFRGGNRKYLVESAGDLLQVWRFIGFRLGDVYESYYTKGFRVFKFDPLEPNSKWIEMKTLEGRILFLGNTTSLSLLALDCPGCTPNCIYFTDDSFTHFVVNPSTGPHDMGVFNLENGSIEPHYLMQSKTILPPPLWIQPVI